MALSALQTVLSVTVSKVIGSHNASGRRKAGDQQNRS
jgi:hypothetical protein